MYLETERLIIRSIKPDDGAAFIEIASDGSLDEDIFGGWPGEYAVFIHDWIAEAMELDREDNPEKEYLAYAAEKGVEIHYEEMPGGHDWPVWDTMIQKFMAFATQ